MQELNHEAILKAGRYTGLSVQGVEPALLLKLYHFMQRLRRVELALLNEYHPADEMRCPIHFCIGQEAVSAALNSLLSADDYLYSHHRSHGYYLAKSAPLNALFG